MDFTLFKIALYDCTKLLNAIKQGKIALYDCTKLLNILHKVAADSFINALILS